MSGSASALWLLPAVSLEPEAIDAHAGILRNRLLSIAGAHTDVRFASSMAAEDMVLVDAIVTSGAPIEIFTIDTGRLHDETRRMVEETERHYGIRIARVAPSDDAVRAYVERYGLNGFYDNEDAKKACCQVRKVAPLNFALAGASAWLTGQRREQSVTRTQLELSEADDARGIAKYNPLFDWSQDAVWSYLRHRTVPLHPLHRQGYPSIGCEPCTRAIRSGEDIRAGRWWWLHQESKECGLHINAAQ
jgi:phosphoadenosine phosphosulfate reductase